MRPLKDVRVLDLTRLLPGAYATLLMADLGADVIKLEEPRGGDPVRTMPPIVGGTSVYFHVLNRNKRSVTLDLRSPNAPPVLDALLETVDIMVESFRPQTARRLGVDAGAVGARHPRVIHASISGFGQTGPYAERAAHDINYEALSGVLSATRTSGRAPDVPRSLIADIGAAIDSTAGILAALYQRERTGRGAAVEVAIHEAALAWLLFPAAKDLMAADAPPSEGRLPIYGRDACYNVYETADGRYLALGALEPKFWAGFCERIGRSDLVPLQFATGSDQARALEAVRTLIGSRRRDEWLDHFKDVDVCLTPVNTLEEALADPHLAARRAVVRRGAATWLPTPITVTPHTERSREPFDWRPAPALGADTEAVLEGCGIDKARLARLRDAGAI